MGGGGKWSIEVLLGGDLERRRGGNKGSIRNNMPMFNGRG